MRIHLGGRSRQSLVTARGQLDAAVKGANASSASELSSHLFFVAEIFATNSSIRRALADNSRDGASKAALMKGLFGSKISASTLDLVSALVDLRWSLPADIVYVVEQLAIEAEASAANIDNSLDRLEDELFSVSRVISENFELRSAIVGNGSQAAKRALIESLLSKNASSSTVKLAVALATGLRGRSIEAAFADYLFGLANRRNRLIAEVRVASALSDDQKTRLAAALEKQVGQPIRVNILVDASVIGGVSVKFADELVDGSISNRLANAGRALVGQK
jgi:F-type H+-transporting ATPase subunit delta